MATANPANPIKKTSSSSSTIVNTPASSPYKFGHGFEVTEVGGEKFVELKTVNNFTGDKTLPMTASGVELIVGNIEALLITV